jgi:peptidoglycan hydrolase FlgJ
MQITNLILSGNTQLNAAKTGSKPSKLHEAAQQFEALMIGEMLKSVRQDSSSGWLGSGDGAGQDSAMDMAESQFAKALALSGGLGLAKMVEHSISLPDNGQAVTD